LGQIQRAQLPILTGGDRLSWDNGERVGELLKSRACPHGFNCDHKHVSVVNKMLFRSTQTV